MTRLLTRVQWEILATVVIVALAVVSLGLVTLWRAVLGAPDDPTLRPRRMDG